MNYVFYDVETTDKHTSFAQIIQFAALYVDENLNEIDRFEIRCKLLPHVVPSPYALAVTGVTPEILNDQSLPTHYEAIIKIKNILESWSPAIFVGFNSLRFDEELLRQAFFQNLHPPYLTNTNGNLRSDLMRIAISADIYNPNSIAVPISDKGNKTFKLDKLAPINGFDHFKAHDAMGDVEATVFVANLIKDRATNIWDKMNLLNNKNYVVNYVMREGCFSYSERYGHNNYSWLVTFCGKNIHNPSQLAVFDLKYNPEDYINLSIEELIKVLNKSPKPIRTLSTNKQPIIMSKTDQINSQESYNLSETVINKRIELIKENNEFKQKISQALSQRYDYKTSAVLEERIYEKFTKSNDYLLMNEFHLAPWGKKLHIAKKFGDERLTEAAIRLIYFHHENNLPKNEKNKMNSWLKKRTLSNDSNISWTTIPKALKQTEILLSNSTKKNEYFFYQLKDFYIKRKDEILKL